MRRRLLVAAAVAAFLLTGVASVRAAEVPFSASVVLELQDFQRMGLGSVQGTATLLADGAIDFPQLDLQASVTTTFSPPSVASCVSPIGIIHDGFAGGRLSATASGFGGALPLSGSLVADVLGGALGAIEVPQRIGALSSPHMRLYTTSPPTSQPPEQAFLSASYSRWTIGPAGITATVDGVVTRQRTARGGMRTSTGGDQQITLVSPMHLYYGGIDSTAASKRRTTPVVGYLTISVPAPSLLASEIAAVSVLVSLAIQRRRRTR